MALKRSGYAVVFSNNSDTRSPNRFDGELNSKQEKQVNFIPSSALRLSELVNDLLDIAKIEAGKVTIRLNHFEISDLFNALKGVLRPIVAQDEVNLIFVEPLDLPTLAQIQIIDTSCGISAEFFPYVFDCFRQADGSMTRSYSGLGLGRDFGRQLVELHGGTLQAQSKDEGQGAIFTIQLPLISTLVENIEKPSAPVIQVINCNYLPVESLPTLEVLQVLVVDNAKKITANLLRQPCKSTTLK